MSEKKVPPNGANVYQRIAAVMRKVRGVAKRAENQQGRYKYAGHEAVTEALRDAYVEHGLVRTCTVESSELVDKGTLFARVRVCWINVDDPEDTHEVLIPTVQPSTLKSGGPSPMQVGMALSYAVKNAEFKTFALTGDDTPDVESDDAAPYEGPYDDEPRPIGRGRQQPPQDDDAFALATEYLGRFTECRSESDIKALREEIRANWPRVRSVPDFGERVVVAIRTASKRLRDEYQRMPGED